MVVTDVVVVVFRVVVVVDGSLLLVVIVVKMGGAVEGGELSEDGSVGVLGKLVVVVLGMVVGTNDVLLDEAKMVVVSDRASVVEDVRVVVVLVGQC